MKHYYGVMKEYSFGNAKALLFNSCEAFKLIRYILRKNPEIIVNGEISKSDWIDYKKN